MSSVGCVQSKSLSNGIYWVYYQRRLIASFIFNRRLQVIQLCISLSSINIKFIFHKRARTRLSLSYESWHSFAHSRQIVFLIDSMRREQAIDNFSSSSWIEWTQWKGNCMKINEAFNETGSISVRLLIFLFGIRLPHYSVLLFFFIWFVFCILLSTHLMEQIVRTTIRILMTKQIKSAIFSFDRKMCACMCVCYFNDLDVTVFMQSLSISSKPSGWLLNWCLAFRFLGAI